MDIEQNNDSTIDVLFLDTEPITVKAMTKLLTKLGCNAKGTTDSNEAIELIKQDPALVVYDSSCMIRVISQKQIREYCPNTYIVGTGIGPAERTPRPTHADCLDVGFDEYVSKDELVDRLKEIVQYKRPLKFNND